MEWSSRIRAGFPTGSSIIFLDCEIACPDEDGSPQFNELLFGRGTPRFCAFDLPYLHSKDLRGMLSRYTVADGKRGWVKIKNRQYSQLIGRDEFFEKRYEAAGAPEIGWDVCARAAAASRP
ncbi:MAG TPA: hypothetical protein VGR48_19210 [Terriglobales bacterium]|nr:hypothetical protein [Terriglobales bacterium]